jgi:hypothetical protein
MRGSVCPDFGVKLMPAVGVGRVEAGSFGHAAAAREPRISTNKRKSNR